MNHYRSLIAAILILSACSAGMSPADFDQALGFCERTLGQTLAGKCLEVLEAADQANCDYEQTKKGIAAANIMVEWKGNADGEFIDVSLWGCPGGTLEESR